jgi:hypothetical protein
VTDQPEPIAEQHPASWVPAPPEPDGTSSRESAASGLADRPEVAVGAAFAGGLFVALILKRLAR